MGNTVGSKGSQSWPTCWMEMGFMASLWHNSGSLGRTVSSPEMTLTLLRGIEIDKLALEGFASLTTL